MVGVEKHHTVKQDYLDSVIVNDMQNSNLQIDLNVFNTTCIEPISSAKKFKAHQCLICQKIFTGKYLYEKHLRSHRTDGENLYNCNICQKSFAVAARLNRHYRTHTGEKPYQCDYCSKSFSVKENLSVHRRIHTKERPYKCSICESAFEHSGKLHRHMRIHTGERPHKCSICNKTFIQSGQLVIHMRTHTGEKPYMCTICEKGFTCSKQLKVHTRTHTGEKPYKCEICNKSFGYSHVLKLHQVAHYGEKFYKCTLCQETFSNKKLMHLHTISHSTYLKSNVEQSTEIFIKSQNMKKMSICNENHNIQEKKMLIIATIKEKKVPKFIFPTATTEKKKKEREYYNRTEVSELIADPSYLSISNGKQNSVPHYHFAKFDSSANSILCKFENNTLFSARQLPSSNRNLEENAVHSEFSTQNIIGNSECKIGLTQTYQDKVNTLLTKNSLEYLTPKITNNIEMSAGSYNTVIRFAKVDSII